MSFDVAKTAVEAAMRAGADYADARTGTDEVESLTVRNQEMEGIDRSTSSGVGVRVLAGGRWGFAATSRQDASEVERTAGLAVEIARAASRRPGDPVALDPFIVPLEEKVALLMEATRRMQTVPGVTFAEAGLDLFRRSTWFASSDGAAIDQVVVHSGGGIEATAVAEGDVQRRSYPNSFRGHIKAAGWEHVRTLGLIEAHGDELAAILVEPMLGSGGCI